MLQQSTREAILLLHDKGHGLRAIARTLRVSRRAVRDVLGRGTAEVPLLFREQLAEPYRQDILELYRSCKGNLVRVHEKLLSRGASLSYPALTAFCRKHALARPQPLPAGQYHFEPGQEMQHDTSPHQAHVGGRLRRVQTASAVLCYSRMIFIQLYANFTRFECKLFLTDALQYFGGACQTCMIDNTHVVVLRGTGAEMAPVPEMAAFAERHDFAFRAHEKGDANRSARVERPFNFVENNFLAGRQFADLRDANQQAVAWCDKVNGSFKRHLHCSPRDLFAVEQPLLRPLPAWVPEVYLLHHRIVDMEGYVNVRSNRYSAPYQLMGRRVEVRESKERIEIYLGPRKVAEHGRCLDANGLRICLPEHRPPRGQGRSKQGPSVQEEQLRKAEPALADYAFELKKRAGGHSVPAMRRLLRMLHDYPRDPLLRAVSVARHYGLYDMERLEQMVLRQLREQYFLLPENDNQNQDEYDDDDDDDDDEENR
jgi:transposase